MSATQPRPLGADLIVFSGAMPHTLYRVAGELVRLGKSHRIAVGGVAAAAFRAAGDRLIVLDGHVLDEARIFTEKLGPR